MSTAHLTSAQLASVAIMRTMVVATTVAVRSSLRAEQLAERRALVDYMNGPECLSAPLEPCDESGRAA